MFSSRLHWDQPANPISRLVDAKRGSGARILDLTESNPARAGIAYPREMLAALADPRALTYDPAPAGLAESRAAVAEYYTQLGVRVDPGAILLTASTSEAYAYLFKLLADPGDEILAPRPSYPLFEFLAALESVQVRHYSLRYDGAWRIDFATLEAGLTPRTRAIIVVNPNNPTGSYLKRAELERLTKVGLPLISDEVFADYAFAPDGERVATLAATAGQPIFCLSGLSKIAGLPQLKMAWVVVSHPEAHVRLELIADTYLSVATPVQIALPRLLACAAAVRDQIARRTAGNLAFLRDAVGPNSACQVLGVEGGWYATLRVPRTRSEEQWALDLLRDDDVLVQPGYFYDFESEAYLVLSLLSDPAVFREGVARLLARGSS